jgi:DNA-binding PadR family transcriptional regulator
VHGDLARGRLRGLRGATLALLVERPAHGYELTSRLNRRLGGTWRVEPKQVYAILDDLAKAQLVTFGEQPNPDRPRQPRVVYHPTPRAPEALRRWMQSALEAVPLRPDVVARIASAAPGDAQELLRVLDEYEGQLLRLREAPEDAAPAEQSWEELTLALARGHTDGYLRAELRWVAGARRQIRAFTSSCPGS